MPAGASVKRGGMRTACRLVPVSGSASSARATSRAAVKPVRGRRQWCPLRGRRARRSRRRLISCGRCGARPSCGIWPPIVRPPARAEVPAAPADLASLAAEASPCHRAGCGYRQCCRQRGRKLQLYQQTWHLLRQIRRHARVLDVVTYRAAGRAGKRASSTSRPYMFCGRCGALPPCRYGHLQCCQRRVRKCQQHQ